MNADGLIKGSTYKFTLRGKDYCGKFIGKRDGLKTDEYMLTFEVNGNTNPLIVEKTQIFNKVNSCESGKSQYEIENAFQHLVNSHGTQRPSGTLAKLTKESLKSRYKINGEKPYNDIGDDKLGGRKSRSRRNRRRSKRRKRKTRRLR